MFSVIVIGGGPCGLRAATLLQKEGFDCLVLEEHESIGRPVNCAGLISRSGVEELGLEIGDYIVNRIRGAHIHSPNGELLTVERPGPVAYVIDREKFDKKLAGEAIRAGVEVRLNAKMIDIRNEKIFIQHMGRGELLKAQIIVGADGVLSKTRELTGISLPKEMFIQAYQVKAKGGFDPDFVDVFFGGHAKNFFGWVIPENNETARAGFGAPLGQHKAGFDAFAGQAGLHGPFNSKSSALIPAGAPLRQLAGENILLVGDAAFQTKASTGGGLVTGLAAAAILAETITGHYKNKAKLADYEKKLRPLNRELESHAKIRQYLNSLGDEKMDRLFVKLKKAGIEAFLSDHGDMDRPSRFMGKLWKKPSMWRLLPEAFALWRSRSR